MCHMRLDKEVKLTLIYAFVVEMVKLIRTFHGRTFCGRTFGGQDVPFRMFLGQTVRGSTNENLAAFAICA